MNSLEFVWFDAKQLAIRQHNRDGAMLICDGVMDSGFGDEVVAEREITVNHARQVNLEVVACFFAQLDPPSSVIRQPIGPAKCAPVRVRH